MDLLVLDNEDLDFDRECVLNVLLVDFCKLSLDEGFDGNAVDLMVFSTSLEFDLDVDLDSGFDFKIEETSPILCSCVD